MRKGLLSTTFMQFGFREKIIVYKISRYLLSSIEKPIEVNRTLPISFMIIYWSVSISSFLWSVFNELDAESDDCSIDDVRLFFCDNSFDRFLTVPTG